MSAPSFGGACGTSSTGTQFFSFAENEKDDLLHRRAAYCKFKVEA